MPVEDPITGRVWLTHSEAARYLGKSDRWLRHQLGQNNKIKVHKRGGTNLFLLSDLEEYEREHERPAEPRRVAAPPARPRRRHRRAA